MFMDTAATYTPCLFYLQIDGMEDFNGSIQVSTCGHDDYVPAAHYECRLQVG